MEAYTSTGLESWEFEDCSNRQCLSTGEITVPRQSNQPKRTRKNRQARATLKPKGVSTAPVTNDAGSTSASAITGMPRAQALQYGAKAADASVARGPATRGLTISREQEYGFIREDLRRLVYTAGFLLVIMFALLFLVDR